MSQGSSKNDVTALGNDPISLPYIICLHVVLEGDVKLIDYGISCEVDNVLAKRHTSVGTPYWMAPEVIMCDEKQCHEYDAR